MIPYSKYLSRSCVIRAKRVYIAVTATLLRSQTENRAGLKPAEASKKLIIEKEETLRKSGCEKMKLLEILQLKTIECRSVRLNEE